MMGVNQSGGIIMLRTAGFFMYFFAYLLYSIPTLRSVRKDTLQQLPVEERDEIIHILPKKWASTLVKIAGGKVKVIGEHNLPKGPVLIVANHEGNFDTPVLIGYIKKPFGFISKVEVKKIPIVSKWMEVMNCVFMDRKDRRQSIQAIRMGIEKLKNGHSLVIFPEGTRSKGGPVGPFKAGSLRLATDSKVPIVPIAIYGTASLMEKNGGWIKPGQVTLSILPAVTPDQYEGKDSKALANEIQERIAAEIEKLRA